MDQIGWIRRLHRREHKSERKIARITGLSRNTVAKWLHGELVEPKYRRAGRPNKLAPFCETLKQALAADAKRARHERRTAKALFTQHYIPLVQRKPGALRNGAPFADLPEPLQRLRLRRVLLREDGGDRLMAKVLALVPTAGLDAVLVAVELALEAAPPSGRVSAEHVLNVLARLNAAPAPETAATALRAKTPPRADTARYDALRHSSNDSADNSAEETDHA